MLIFIKFILFFFCIGCGLSAIKPILSGINTIAHSYPWMVSIGFTDSINSFIHICGGSLINSQYVLTAAHCVDKNVIYPLFANHRNQSLITMGRVYIGIYNLLNDIVPSNTYFISNIIIVIFVDLNLTNFYNIILFFNQFSIQTIIVHQ